MERTENKRKLNPFILILLIVGFLALYIFWGGNQAASAFKVTPVDLEATADGVYGGQSELAPIKVEVEVLVEDHRIKDIRILKHDNGLGFRAEKPVIQAILDKQTNVVDSVTGATVSSKVIMDAVGNALKVQ